MFNIGFHLALSISIAAAVLIVQARTLSAQTGTCSPTKVAYNLSKYSQIIASRKFVRLRGAVVRFRQGGTTPSCVLVEFSAEPSAEGSSVIIRALLDGSVAGLPDEQVLANDSVRAVNSSRFIFPDVPPGRHVVRILFRRNGKYLIGLHQPVLIVQHAENPRRTDPQFGG